jgi:hypothetical protein
MGLIKTLQLDAVHFSDNYLRHIIVLQEGVVVFNTSLVNEGVEE